MSDDMTTVKQQQAIDDLQTTFNPVLALFHPSYIEAIETAIGEPLHEWVRRWRADGYSWARIAQEVLYETDRTYVVQPDLLAAWYESVAD